MIDAVNVNAARLAALARNAEKRSLLIIGSQLGFCLN